MLNRHWLRRSCWVLCFPLLASAILADDSDQRPKPIVPKLQEDSGEANTAIGSFKKPAGWTCDLFASEPMMGNPVAFAIDLLGRVVVCESYRQNKGVTDNRGHDNKWLDADLAAETVEDRIRYHRELLGDKAVEYETFDDLLRLLVDTDGDFRADKATVYASGFNGIEEGTGAGALIRGNKIYYTNIPKLWELIDKDNDGVADERVVLSDGYGIRVAFRGHDMHGLIIGPDGRLYFSIGDRGYHVQTPNGLLANPESGAVFRCELDGSKLEVVATGLRNPQELAFDDYGNLFTGDNNSDSGDRARWVYVVRGGDSGWRMMYQYIPDRGPFNREKIWYPFSEETPAYTVPPIANVSDGPSGLVCYPGTGLTPDQDHPDRFQNAFFLVDFRGQASNSGIRLIRTEPKGAFFELKENSEFVWNILATDVDFGPDGGMYVSDWVNGWDGQNKGRIYRFADADAQASEIVRTTRHVLGQGMTGRTEAELAEFLSHPDRRVRSEAQWELANRSATQTLVKVYQKSNNSTLARLHAVWGLGQILRTAPSDSSTAQTLIAALSDPEAIVAAKAAEALADAGYKAAAPQVAELLKHESSVAKSAACMALGLIGNEQQLPTVLTILEANDNQDPILRHAGIMALAGITSGEKLATLKTHGSEAVRLAAVVALRKQNNPTIAQFLSDTSPKVLKEAVRAIHDLPALHSQLKAVAELHVAPEHENAVVSRVLNANFRLGTAENAERLVRFAAYSNNSDALRIEALDMLATWKHPGKRDRVMNRHMPLADRDESVASSAIRGHIEALSAAPIAVRDRFLEVGSKLGLTEIKSLILQTAQDAKAEGTRRAAAIRALYTLAPESLNSLLDKLVADSNVDVRMASLSVLVQSKPQDAVPILVKAISSDNVRERQFAWDQLPNLPKEAASPLLEKGVQAYLDGKLQRDSWLNVVEAANERISGKLQKTLQDRLAELDAVKENDPKKSYEDCIEGGDVDQGRFLFFTRSNLSCVRCHKVGETGGEVGPNLSNLGTQKTREYLLEAIVAPNAAIAQGFETVVILDDSGNTYTGILKSEDDTNVVLMDANGNLVTVEKDSIEGRRKGLSSMPAGLMKYLTRRELRDLVAYLASLDGTPAAVVGLGGPTGGHQVE